MNLGGRAVIQPAMSANIVVVVDEVSDAAAGLRAGGPFVDLGAFVVQGPDETLHEDVVLPAFVAGHALLDAELAQRGLEAA